MSLACSRRSWILAVAVAIACSGCGDEGAELLPVNGKVILDGEPLTIGNVITMPPAGRGANGAIQSDGSFTLRTGDQVGAVPGTHKVGVVAYEAPANAGPEAEQGKPLVPQRYAAPESSGLTIDVKSDGENSPVLELTSP